MHELEIIIVKDGKRICKRKRSENKEGLIRKVDEFYSDFFSRRLISFAKWKENDLLGILIWEYEENSMIWKSIKEQFFKYDENIIRKFEIIEID